METINNTPQSNIPGDPALFTNRNDPEASASHKQLVQRGLKWLGTGVGMMAVSFGINFFLFQAEESYIFLMYGLTTVGAFCLFKGLADIVGL